MQRFILDTSLFTNPAIYQQFAGDPYEAIAKFLEQARQSRSEFYMPSSVYEEFGKIRNLEAIAAEFEAIIRIRSPRRYDVKVPGALLHDFIDEVRIRIDRGLKIAEEHARLGSRTAPTEDAGALINKLRGKYREALRQGILDSKEDADVLLLTIELEGILVSADQGLQKWADRAGVEIAKPENLSQILAHLPRLGDSRRDADR